MNAPAIASGPGQPYTVGDYLLDRLAELGVTEVFGVPGDFNLQFLDHIVAHPQLRWVGNANELNAGYAADGYARLRRIGAVVTTYGVGELSAVNAIAGSFAEHAPVVHIVGVPSRDIQVDHRIVHHTLGDGDFNHFRRIAAEITCAQADLSPADACEEIDRVLRSVQIHRLPGYIMLATDVARVEVSRPVQPLGAPREYSSENAKAAFREAAEQFLSGREVAVLADVIVDRLGATDALNTFLSTRRLPHATLMWGKTLVDESAPHFLGTYAGAVSDDFVREAIENAERLIMAGVRFNDTTTAGFSQQIDPSRTIVIDHGKAVVGGSATFAPLTLKAALDILTDLAGSFAEPAAVKDHDVDHAGDKVAADGAVLRQDEMWPIIAGALTDGNILVADQGTSFFGLATLRLPSAITFIGQPMWGSIGYTLPAALGAALACPDRRAVLVIGDGAAQLTIQELGTWIREKVAGVIIVVNNDGYTVERAIHGPEAIYNDISPWDWAKIPAALGARDDDSMVLRASTPRELREAIVAATAAHDKLVFLEVVTEREDYPSLLTDVAAAITQANSR